MMENGNSSSSSSSSSSSRLLRSRLLLMFLTRILRIKRIRRQLLICCLLCCFASLLNLLMIPSKRIDIDIDIEIDIPSYSYYHYNNNNHIATVSTTGTRTATSSTASTTSTTNSYASSKPKPTSTSTPQRSKSKSKSKSSSNSNSNSLFEDAVEECDAIHKEFGVYPSIMTQLIEHREGQYYNNRMTMDPMNPIFKMAGEKLGDKIYASMVGIRTPKLYFCGQAKDLPTNISSLGSNNKNEFVLKPIFGHSAKGVKVISNGQDKFKKKKTKKQNQNSNITQGLSYNSLIEQYGPDTYLIAEELVESFKPKFKGMVPPDYKFYVYGNQTVENLLYVDRNKNNNKNTTKRVHNCARSLRIDRIIHNNNNSNNNRTWIWKWEPLQYQSTTVYQPCELDDDDYGLGSETRNNEMMMAVKRLSTYLNDNYMRIDMFDSKDGPMLGEFTPFPAHGRHEPYAGCINSYLFIHHAIQSKVSDDAQLTLRHIINNNNRHRPQQLRLFHPKNIYNNNNNNNNNNNTNQTKTNTTLIQALGERIMSWIPSNWTNDTLNEFYNNKDSNDNDSSRHWPPTPSFLLREVANAWSNLTLQEKCDQALIAQREYFK